MANGELTPEQKRQMHLISTLPQNEAFLIWRDTVCYPILEQIKATLKGPDIIKMSHVELLARTMHKNSMENLFTEIFDQTRFIDKENQA